MNIRDILNDNSHRPDPMPPGRWSFYQEWHEVLSLHWTLKPDAIRAFIPSALELSTFKGNALVPVVLFRLAGLRPGFLPALPSISYVDEVNIRTYVQYKS